MMTSLAIPSEKSIPSDNLAPATAKKIPPFVGLFFIGADPCPLGGALTLHAWENSNQLFWKSFLSLVSIAMYLCSDKIFQMIPLPWVCHFSM